MGKLCGLSSNPEEPGDSCDSSQEYNHFDRLSNSRPCAGISGGGEKAVASEAILDLLIDQFANKIKRS